MPNLAWTYNTLLQALQDWPVHASAIYLRNLPNLIGLGERRLWGDLDIEEYDKTDNTSIQMGIGTRAVNKPSDVIQVRTAAYIHPVNGFTYLEKRSSEYCQSFSPLSAAQAPPQYYHELAFNQIEVVPTPDQAYQMYYRYIGAPAESLNPTTPTATTWLSRAGPDALFAACLAEAEHFIKADDRYADMLTKYQQELVPRLRNELRKSMRTGDYQPLQPAAMPIQ
ncbi:MAG TPA: hypothetical protein VLH80_07450 [Nitrospiraceae bacterium]|nr:hypothetical protein [Nitrospiraceae bacterium]